MLRSSWVITGPRSLKLIPVVRMSGQERRRAVELLAQQHLRERVRQRQRGEAQQQRSLALDRRVQSIGAADDEGGRLAKQRGELPGGQVFAALIEGDQPGFFRNSYSGSLYLQQRDLIAPRHAPQVFVPRAARPCGQITCDGDELEPCHASASLSWASLPLRA